MSSKISGINRFMYFARRHWKWMVQAAVLLLILSWLVIAWINLNQNLAARNFGLGFDFLWNQAGFAIGESPIPFSPTDFYITAMGVGLLNTCRVVVLGLVLATLLGITVGLGRLSSNWLVNRLAAVYVQGLRNTPLLLQLLFWYSAFFCLFPRLTRLSISIIWPISVSKGCLSPAYWGQKALRSVCR
ncbi:MAG: ABC transporter permease subunit [Acaryochloridaceae cyanobacterium RL_2_7]|nr:ABC transporter permease subunit [Acaryochloridaceae cyanobacterium RL_2_7]